MRTRLLLCLGLVLLAMPLLAHENQAASDAADAAARAGTMLIFSTVFGGIIRPVLNVIVRMIPDRYLTNDLTGGLSAGVCLIFFLLGWGYLGGTSGTPDDWQTWVLSSFAAVGIGTTVNAAGRKLANGGTGDGGKPSALSGVFPRP